MKKIHVQFLLMNTVVIGLVALGIVNARSMPPIVLLMVLLFGYLLFAAWLFKKQVDKGKSKGNSNL